MYDATRARPPGQMWIALHKNECEAYQRNLCVHHAHNSIRGSLIRDGHVRWDDSPEFYRVEVKLFVEVDGRTPVTPLNLTASDVPLVDCISVLFWILT